MSDESTWTVFGNTLYMSPQPSAAFVVFPGDAGAAQQIAERHNAQLSALVAEVEQWHATNRDAAQALAQAEAKASILQAQLGGWEAQCAAQLLVLQDVSAFLGEPHEHPADDSGMRELAERVRTVSETDAGRLLLGRLEQAERALRTFVEIYANTGGKTNDLVQVDLFNLWLYACGVLGIAPVRKARNE